MNTHSPIDVTQNFLRRTVPSEKAVFVFLSGGVDSDVVARLAVATFGAARVVGATCIQSGQEPAHPSNAARLAAALGINYAQLHLRRIPALLAAELAKASQCFDDGSDSWLLEARAKCALRTAIAALYHDRGFYILGCGNRTELRLGFFMPLGDGICHAAPILHLFKTEVYALAQALGTEPSVIDQPASAGFWAGQSDLEDIAYWMVHGGPIIRPTHFSEADLAQVKRTRSVLTFAGLDSTLREYERGAAPAQAALVSGLEVEIVERVYRVADAARRLKLIPMCESLLSAPASP